MPSKADHTSGVTTEPDDAAGQNKGLGFLRTPSMSDVDALFAGYLATVPAMAGSLATALYFGASTWGTLTAIFRVYDYRVPRRAAPFVLSCIYCFFAFLITSLVAGNIEALPPKILSFVSLLMVPLFVCRFRYSDPERTLGFLCRYAPLGVLGGIAAFIVSGFDAGGAGNPNIFGLAIAVLGAISLAGVFVRNWYQRLAGLAGYCASLTSVVLSESRSMVLAMVLLPLLMVILVKGVNRYVVLGGVVLIGIVTAGLSPIIISQFEAGLKDIETYGENTELTSLGARMTLWTAAVDTIADSPWVGYGVQNKMDAVYQRIHTTVAMPKYSHVHNEFLDSLVAGGIPALIGLVLVLFSPLLMVTAEPRHAMKNYIICSMVLIFLFRALAGSFLTHDLVIVLFLISVSIAAAFDLDRRDFVVLRAKVD